MDRRNFLRWQLRGLFLLSASSPVFSLAKPLLASPFPDVAVVKGGGPGRAARAAVELMGGMGRFVKPGQSVVIKPNMSFARPPENAVNTHPEVVREVLVMCKEAGAGRIRVLDHSLQNPQLSLERSGILAACDSVEPGLCHHLMNAGQYREAELSQAVEMRGNAIMRDVLEADVLIAVPIAKSHGSAGVSLALKGQMGLILDRHSMHSRYSLDTAIVDLNTRLKPSLTVIDATRVLSSNGPGGPGVVLTPGEVICSADPVAADATAVDSYEWYGRKIAPRQVGYIRQAHERGLGRMDIENLDVRRITL
ncbi:MAG: DUF362 domain-containing protein [Deltaproteobacteria bacterium]|jgi:uncharacterized protein (DUF362 family)|nr:DUF362 domain-containing protein [Deltaproteobacteria bacterium]